MSEAPVVVIGAGPQGLAAAAHLVERGLDVRVFERGAGPAAAIAEWGHVRLFSPWPELIDSASRRLLEASGWVAPASGYPTGAEWIAGYLAPLAEQLEPRIQYDARVVAVVRQGRDLTIDEGRVDQPFAVHIRHSDGTEERHIARAVIDASGTWATPNPAGAEGIAALGETQAAAAGLVEYRIPAPHDAIELTSKHVVVVGNGHSAMTAINLFADVARAHPKTRVTWVLRRGAVGNTFGGGDADGLARRGALGQRARAAVDEGLVNLVTGFRTVRIDDREDGATLVAADGREIAGAERVFVLTGYRPDLSFLSELRLDLDSRLQAPSQLAVEIDPNLHSCGSVRATGAADLAHQETGFTIVGAKSYGRAPTFLALTGFEQVRSVVAALAGDHEAAARVELTLPETGVCGGSGFFDAPAEEMCCEPAGASEALPQPSLRLNA